MYITILLYTLCLLVCTLVRLAEHPVQFLDLVWGQKFVHFVSAEKVMVCEFESGNDSLPTSA